MSNHVLGRILVQDGRDASYLMADVLPEEDSDITMRFWNSVWHGNQGRNPYCVAFAWLHWMADEPIVHRAAPIYRPRDIYATAQKLDAFAGENYQGTTVRAGAKALRQHGVITEFRWAWDVETVINAVLNLGPVVVGTNWYEGMYNTDANGFVEVAGQFDGGHAYVLSGVDTKEEFFWAKNSWGTKWGDVGYFRISIADMETLLGRDGEACIANERLLEQYK